jgi:transcriptional regulator with XRE-family HTH domain
MDSKVVNKKVMESEGKRFKQARQKLGLTLVDMVNMTGYSMSTISGVENEHDVPSKRLRQLLIERLDLNEEWLKSGRGQIFNESQQTALAKIITDETKIYSPAEQNIRNDKDFVAVINKLRIMPHSERKQHLVAMHRTLDSLVKLDKKSHSKKSEDEKHRDEMNRLFAELLVANAEDHLSKTAASQKKPLTNEAKTLTNEAVQSILPKLIQRLKRATEARGSKSELAAWLGVHRQSVTDWLSGKQEPGGETTLKLLQWVEQQERQK